MNPRPSFVCHNAARYLLNIRMVGKVALISPTMCSNRVLHTLTLILGYS